ncbi:unnamed protein product [Toxocara canis]|uniref:CFA20_dom domain-containing protein n=1 Tax=Toxocara canis TaxID=6265 RepID=A0A183UYQ9_TOXCA|nr:unnamed protein product [Toxocara canis]
MFGDAWIGRDGGIILKFFTNMAERYLRAEDECLTHGDEVREKGLFTDKALNIAVLSTQTKDLLQVKKASQCHCINLCVSLESRISYSLAPAVPPNSYLAQHRDEKVTARKSQWANGRNNWWANELKSPWANGRKRQWANGRKTNRQMDIVAGLPDLDKKVRNGHIKRIMDDEIQSLIIEIMGANLSTYIMPYGPEEDVGHQDVSGRRITSQIRKSSHLFPLIPMRLDDGWNQIQFNLSNFIKRALFYFAGRLYTEDELPAEFKSYLPIRGSASGTVLFSSGADAPTSASL